MVEFREGLLLLFQGNLHAIDIPPWVFADAAEKGRAKEQIGGWIAGARV